MKLFRPSETVSRIFEIDFARLYKLGKRAVIFDLDKTLGRRRPESLDPAVVRLLERLTDTGFRVGILTNRRRADRDPFLRSLCQQYPLVHRAGKPSKRGFLELLKILNASPQEAVMVGDRFATDIFGANRLAIYSVRVRHS
jgi:HAD superfamily phosphatase (TIGR01668 family)